MKYFFILIFSLYSFKSYSGFLFEPYLGLDFSVSGKTTNCCTEVSWFNFEIGARLGYAGDNFNVGLDLDYKNMDPSYTYYGSEFDQDTAVNNIGLFAAWVLNPWVLRIKYYFDSNWTLKEDGPYGPDGQTNSGTGFGIDAAYRFSKFVSFNLEFTRIDYDIMKGIKVGSGDQLKTSDILLSVSFPFDLVSK